MAHEVENMAYAGQIPWHGLGTKVNNDISVDDMLKESGLNWYVTKQALYIGQGQDDLDSPPDYSYREIPLKALVRNTDDKILTYVGAKWNPVQNKEAFEFFREWVEAGDMEMHTAGSLLGGKKVWVLAKLKDTFEVVSDDRIEGYMLFTNPHEFGTSLNIRFTPTRVVCNNTLQIALGGRANGYSLDHRKPFDPREVKLTMGLVQDSMKDYEVNARILSKNCYKQESLNEYFAELFPKSKYEKETPQYLGVPSQKHRLANRYLMSQPGSDYGFGTWWHAFNTVTYLYDHKLGRNDTSRLNSNFYGTGMQSKRKAFTKALEYASK